jgi:hypothetical protein
MVNRQQRLPIITRNTKVTRPFPQNMLTYYPIFIS